MPGKTQRVKDLEKNHLDIMDGLSPKMRDFTSVMSTKFPDIWYNSGKREASDKVGSSSGHSHHNTGMAIDIDKNNTQVFDYLMNNKEGLEFLVKNGFGIIDETDPAVMSKTGATGAHFHIGADSHYVKQAKDRLANFDNLGDIKPYISKTNEELNTQIPIGPDKNYLGAQEDLSNVKVEPVYVVLKDVIDEVAKDGYKEGKVKDSEARQTIDEVMKAKQDMIAAGVPQYYTTPNEQGFSKLSQYDDPSISLNANIDPNVGSVNISS